MAVTLYVKVRSDFIRFTKNGEYATTKNRLSATPFTRKSDIVAACRKAGIDDFKIVPSTVRKM